MEDYRCIEIEESEDEHEDEEEDEEEDNDVGEYEEDIYHEEIMFRDLRFNSGEEDRHDDEEEEEEEEEEDDEEEEDYEDEEEDELIPAGRMIPWSAIEDDDSEEEEMKEFIPVEITSSRVSNSIIHGGHLEGEVVVNNGLVDGSNVSELRDRNPGNQELNRGETDGLFFPICFEAWTSSGDHQIYCLPCGHMYGLSCIKKWLQQRQSSGKCPQCNSLCTSKDIRVLYTARLCVADEELQKRVRSLKVKCADLEQKVASLTPEDLIDKICSNKTLVQRLVTVLAELQQQHEDRLHVFEV